MWSPSARSRRTDDARSESAWGERAHRERWRSRRETAAIVQTRGPGFGRTTINANGAFPVAAGSPLSRALHGARPIAERLRSEAINANGASPVAEGSA